MARLVAMSVACRLRVCVRVCVCLSVCVYLYCVRDHASSLSKHIYASCPSVGVFTANPSCHLFNYYADAAVSSLIDFKHCLLMAVGSGD